ncbi:MAG: homocysteine S-methyltransferase family protein [Clostridia bacterium]|nr:homocysteine S-methyltransferase family protein [Clostridia bacterium]
MKNFSNDLKSKYLFFDGGTGTVLQSLGLKPGEAPESWSLTHPDKITELHRSYLSAGANIIKANTFGINPFKYDNYAELISASITCAKEALIDYPDAYIAYDLGPLGRLLTPLGDLSFEEAVSAFSACLLCAVDCGCDLILIETMSDSYETKAAVVAAKEVTDLPIIVTNAYGEDGKVMTGADAEAMSALLEGLGVDAFGANCSYGPDMMLPIAEKLLSVSSTPIVMNPNAGLPTVVNGKTVYTTSPAEFAKYIKKMAEMGVTLLGGCCGTTPEHIKEAVKAVKGVTFKYPTEKNVTVVSSYAKAVKISKDPILIGERINPTGKPKLKAALREGDIGYLLLEASREEEAGAHILDVNVGLPDIDEPKIMEKAVKELQSVTALPLQLDSADPNTLEHALRIYNGKPLVNSVNGEKEKMDAIFPLVKKYGGTVVALTIDENGIPDTVDGRVEIALKIAAEAEKYGISKKDMIVDPLALSVSADKDSALITLGTVRKMTELGFRTVLGVSNISFGLPEREKMNSTFFALALENGLSSAIMNPFSASMLDTYHAFRVLHGLDNGCIDYISYADKNKTVTEAKPQSDLSLSYCILKGMAKEASEIASKITSDPLGVINSEIIPALNEIGQQFEEKKAYLPQLLMSADAASGAISELKKLMPTSSDGGKGAVILATVKGDIHDIGKNIVKVLLESYGFKVYDLGRDVSPETVLDAVKNTGCKLVGLSALMTTTVPSMEATVKLLHSYDCEIKVMVGGAVLNEEYAQNIGADKYSPDAMGSVRFAEEFYGI